ncbi:MAG: TniQ family protein, partial [Mycobacterium sp.]
MTVRALPIRLAPVPGEGLDSYLEALAHRGDVVWADMLAAVGLSPGCCDSSGMYRWLTTLTDTEATNVSSACGVSPSAVHAMTIGHAIPAGMAMIPGRSRFCPDCLDESGGRWQLWWRERWAFACTQHHRLLADRCPHCGCCPCRRRLRHDQIPNPGSCASRTGTGHDRRRRRCAAVLSAASTLYLGDGHRALAAQSTIVTAIRHGVTAEGVYRTSPVTARLFLTDVAQLSRRMHRWAGPTYLDDVLPADVVNHYRSPSTTGLRQRDDEPLPGVTATAAAIAAVLATDVLLCPDVETAGAALRPALSAAHHHGHRHTVSSVTRHAQTGTALRSVQL